jgi:hypothetical protein
MRVVIFWPHLQAGLKHFKMHRRQGAGEARCDGALHISSLLAFGARGVRRIWMLEKFDAMVRCTSQICSRSEVATRRISLGQTMSDPDSNKHLLI